MELRDMTLPQLLDEAAKNFQNCQAIESDGTTKTWGEISALTEEFTNNFAQYGIKKGEHVGIWGSNSINWILTFFALTKLGAVAVLANPNATVDELSKMAGIAELDWLLYGDSPRGIDEDDFIEQLHKNCPQLVNRTIDIRNRHTHPCFSGVDALPPFEKRDDSVADALLQWMDFWSPGNHDDRTMIVFY